MYKSAMQCTDITKAVFALMMPYGFVGHAELQFRLLRYRKYDLSFAYFLGTHNCQQHYVQTCYTKFQLNRTINMKTMDRNFHKTSNHPINFGGYLD